MNPSSPGDRANLVLALHSCSETFGVGLQALSQADQPAAAARMETFPAGRHLSNRLLECVETVLPARDWPRLVRLGVATGPGGFTGTRLSVVMARTLAQQLELPLDGVSGFWLMARRLWRGAERGDTAPFWLVQDLPRHGVVAGLYEPDARALGGMVERQAPRLFRDGDQLTAQVPCPLVPARTQLPDDLSELLAFCQASAASGRPAPWQPVLPLYPTSPVGQGR